MTYIVQTKKNKVSKEFILQKTRNGLEVFKFYINDFQEVGKLFKAVFREEEHPSANIYQSNSGEFLYKDFAEGDTLNCFSFVKKLKSIEIFSEVLKQICNDLKLNYINKGVIFEEGGNFDYWDDYSERSVMKGILDKYKVKSLKSFTTKSGFIARSKPNNPSFAFEITSNSYKVYRPLEQRKFKHQWIGTKPIIYNNIFGIEQLPEHCKVILVTEGLKDCIVANANLNRDNIFTIGLDNVSTQIPDNIISLLKTKCDYLVLCLDIDEKGLEGSKKKSEQYGLRNFLLPRILKEKGGKDISDWFKLRLEKELLINSLQQVLESPEPTIIIKKQQETSILIALLKTEQLIKANASKEIFVSPPLIQREGVPIFRTGTINVIQGKMGSHKSRIAELLCSLMLSKKDSEEFLGFSRDYNLPNTVIYIDTERNTNEELPFSIQCIKKKAGFSINDEIDNFRFCSIIEFPRKQRLEAISTFIEAIRNKTTSPIFVVLDVSTDCISDFNSVENTLEFLDYLRVLTEKHAATFLLIIHENPSSEKARGHLGTEIGNKSSTLIKIGFHGNSSDLLELEIKKLRIAKRPPKLFLTYSEESKGLALADKKLIANHSSPHSITVEAIADELTNIFVEPTIKQKDLLSQLQEKFDLSENTLKTRLEEIEEQQIEIFNTREEPCTLQKQSVAGKATIYELVLLKDLY